MVRFVLCERRSSEHTEIKLRVNVKGTPAPPCKQVLNLSRLYLRKELGC